MTRKLTDSRDIHRVKGQNTKILAAWLVTQISLASFKEGGCLIRFEH